MMRFPLLLALLAFPALAAQPLQTLIDATPTGGRLDLPPGRYAGPVAIERPLTLDGHGKAIIDGGGKGTVLKLLGGKTTVRNLLLTGSGETHDGMDSGIQIESDDNLVESNVIEDALFGIHIRQGNRNVIRGNRVTGKDLSLEMRGDGLRLWNSRSNRIENNRFSRVRDLTLANSPDNRITGNHLEHARYGTHLVFSPRTVAENNHISHTATGIVLLYSGDVVLRGNSISHAFEGGGAGNVVLRGNSISHAFEGGGAGIVFKDSGEGLVEGNDIIHCAAGLQANAPLSTESVLTIRNNRFANNVVGMYFYGEKGGHRITNNRFENNLSQVVSSAPGTGEANVWHGNYWSDYQGFDRNGDGIGDTSHELYAYADRLWMEIPKAKFFANSPVLELLDFLERLAPFSSPSLILHDPAPKMQ